MKKIISILLIISMLLLFSGCGRPRLVRGTLEGDVYTNESLGITFTKPATWVYYTDEEIAEAMEIGVEVFASDDLEAALEIYVSIHDMMVADVLKGNNISVGYENLTDTYYAIADEERYVELIKSQYAEGVGGLTFTFGDELKKVTLGNTEFTRTVCHAFAYGVTLTQAYYLHKNGPYMAYIIVTVVDGYTLEEVEAMFS